MRYIIREHLFHLGEDSDITDESGQVVYHVDGKVLSLRGLLTVTDPSGTVVAQVQRKLISMVPTYEISVGDEDVEVRGKFFSPFGDRYAIDVPGLDDLQIDGDLLDHEFTVKRGGQRIATVSKRWFSMTATYGVDIDPGQNDLVILASVLAVDLAEDRERR